MIDPENTLVIVLLTNKIHSGMIPDDESLSQYNGNFYTAASLGFAPQIIEMGMSEERISDEQWAALVSDMAADAKRQIDKTGITDDDHPTMRAYHSLLYIRY